MRRASSQTLREAAATGEAETARRAAHTLKGNGRTFGAEGLASLCLEAETAAAAGDLDAVRQRLELRRSRVGAGCERRSSPPGRRRRTSSQSELAPASSSSARDELVDPNRLADVVVHAGLEARLAIAVHRVRGHGDDPRPAFGVPARIRRVASSPSISGICTSMRTTSYSWRSTASTASIPFAATSAS